jgi:predicted ATPase/DNA-binding SARP family transcriptional activator
MAHLSLSLLGSFHATLDGQPVTGFESNKVRALLAYLAVEAGRAHPRDVLAALLWPDRPDRAALANLRNAIADLRTAVGDRRATPPFLLISRETIQFNEASDHWLDVAAFKALKDTTETDRTPTDALQESVKLYRGDFLRGFSVSGCPAFEDWSLLVRERLQRQVLAALDRLVERYEGCGKLTRACEAAWRWVELAPWEEEAHQQVMRLLALSGRRTAALAQYESCRRALWEELAIEPAPETLRLYERIRDGDIGRPREDETALDEQRRPSNLPVPLTSFVGREMPRAEIRALLLDPACRLLTLTGAGGSGKTRLALQVASDLADAFTDGVFLVELASVRDPTLVVSAIAGTFGVRESGGTPLIESLKYLLRDKERLLVLDNFEQVLEAAPLVGDLLTASPRLKVLVTSRSPLHVYGEHDYRLAPMVTPDLDDLPPAEHLAQVEAVELFVQRAMAARADFALGEENAPAIAEICARLDGLPLAIELAAARVRLFSPRAMLPHLDHRLRFLAGGPVDLPTRQRTLQATIDWSHDLLDADEQALFRRLSVFLGGWTLEAAEAVCLASSSSSPPGPSGEVSQPASHLALLESLTDRNLVQVSDVAGEPRFTMLETIREYALERLAESGELEATRGRHAHFFLSLAQETDSELWGPGAAAWLDRLEREHDNLRAALAWSLEHDVDVGLRLAGALGPFWTNRGHNSEGRSWLAEAMARSAAYGPTLDRYRARTLMWSGWLVAFLDDHEAAVSLGDRSVSLWRSAGEAGGLARALARLAWVVWRRDRARAHALFEESFALYRQVDDPPGLAFALWADAHRARHENDYARARASAQESLELARQSGATAALARATGVLGAIALAQGDYAAAQPLLEESLALCREAGDRLDAGNAVAMLGDTWYAQGELDRARACWEEGFRIFREIGHDYSIAVLFARSGYLELGQGRWEEARALLLEIPALCRGRFFEASSTAACLVGWAGLAEAQEQIEPAARLLGAVEALLQHVHWHGTVLCLLEYERIASAVRSQLDEDTLPAAWAEGRAMTPEQAIAYAAEIVTRSGTIPAAGQTAAD